MIKKLLLMSVSIVLGCMITTASFARWEPPSQDCKDAKVDAREKSNAVRIGNKKNDWPSSGQKMLQASKRACQRVRKAICPRGSYADADPVDVVECDNVEVVKDENSNIIRVVAVSYNEDGSFSVCVIERNRDSEIPPVTMICADPLNRMDFIMGG
jgi:hypothetical protein